MSKTLQDSLSQSQKNALNALWQWFRREFEGRAEASNKVSSSAASPKARYITLGGYAGTGKTTAIAIFRAHLRKTYPKMKIAFVSFTGKAARVLQNTLQSQQPLGKNDFVGTIHSLIYSPVMSGGGKITGWKPKDEIEADLIMIDEASMVDHKIWADLLSYEVPIIAVGDHGQLPPIEGNFNLMKKPDLVLEEIHRQAAGNPIIKVSLMARQDGVIPPGEYGKTVKKILRSDMDAQEEVQERLTRFTPEHLVLCGYNNTRLRLNQSIRQSLGKDEPEPQPGDRVLCLRNNYTTDVYNGMLGTIHTLRNEYFEGQQSFEKDPQAPLYYAEIDLDDRTEQYRGLIAAQQFGEKSTLRELLHAQASAESNGYHLPVGVDPNTVDLFDFGYALTVHKAQGSQAPKVLLFEERFKQMDDEAWRRWLYTAVTRAQEELFIVGE